MPNWNELTENLSVQLDAKSTDALKIASEYSKEYGKSSLVKKLTELLHIDDAKPGDVHKKLARIRDFDTIITTNFEFLLEHAYQVEDKPVQVIAGDKNIVMYSPSTHTNIIKIHGDFRNPSEIVITKEDYDEFLEKYPVLATNLWNILKLS